MPKQVLIESRNQTIEFPDDATQEEIEQYIAQEFPRTGEDVAYDLSKYTNAADIRDFIAAIPDEDYIKLNNYRADKKLSWGELAGIAGDAVGTIVGDALSGVKNAVTKAGEGVIESAARGVGAGTIDLVTLGQKLVTPNERIPTLEEFLQTTKDKPAETIADETFPFSFGRKQVLNTEADYKPFIDRQRLNELQALDLAEASEKLIKGAPVPEVAKGASYLDAITLAGLAKSVAKAGVKTIYKKAATAAIPSPVPAAAFSTVEQVGTFIPAGIRQNAENFASKVGEGARKAGFTGVEFGAKGVKTAADLGKGVIDVANELGLKNAAVRAGIGAGIGYEEGGKDQAMLYGILGSALPVAARKGLAVASGTADFIGAAAKVRKTGPARAGIFERMASTADISPEARAVAERLLFAQPFVQVASDAVKQAAQTAAIAAPVGAALGYAADGEQGAAAGFGSGLAIGTLSGPLDAGIDAIKTIAGKSTSRTRANAAADIRSFVNSIADDQARTAYAEVMNKAIEVAGPERAADMLDNLRLAEAMGATVEVVPVGKRKEAFNAFEQKGPAGGTITINPDRMTAGTVSHETFHQLFNVSLKGELQKALSDVYLPKVDEAGNVIRPGLFSDAELAKKAEQLAARYANNPRGYKQSLEYAETLNNQAGRTPEEINEARMFLIDEMTAEYAESFMGRSRPGVFNPDRLPLWHRQILQGIDDMVLNKITDKVYGNKNIKDPTAAFVDEQGKPIRVPQLDAVLKRAFSNKMNRSRGTSAKPKEIIIPTNPRDLVAWASTFGSTRDVIKQDENGKPAILTKEEQKTITAADFEEAKTVYQALPPEAKQTVLVTNKAGSPIDINNKGARIQITSKTPEDVFNAFLEAAKKRGMGNQQLANMRQFYASMIAEDGPTFNTVNNPVYEYNKKTGTMKATVRPPTRQEIYPTAITINSAGGFNVDYIDLSRVKANAEKIIQNPKYRGVWPDVDGFMADFGRSLKNLSLGETDAKATAELLGNGDAKMGALKRDLIAEAMNVTLPKRLKDKGYVNEPTIDPLTLFTNEGKERRIGGSAFRDFRIERLTEVTPTNERLKMVKENAYDLLVQRFQPDAFAREILPAGETLTNPDGYRILKKTGSKLFRVYDDQGELIGVAKNELGAMRMAQRKFIDGWHGSPHNFMRFMTQKIGAGEGRQDFGYGLYIAESPIVAKGYKERLSSTPQPLGNRVYDLTGFKVGEGIIRKLLPLESLNEIEAARSSNYDLKQVGSSSELKRIADASRQASKESGEGGSLYRVQLNVSPDQLLDWDKPLSEQSENVRNAITKAAPSVKPYGIPIDHNPTGAEIYGMMSAPSEFGPKKTSELLKSLGIPGIRYFDERSRSAGEGTRNYVIFDDGLIRIIDRNGKSVGKRLFRDVAEEGYNVRFQPDDFAKKASQEERQTRFQPVSPEQDAAYLSAVKSGDSETAQRMVDEAAKRAGYTVKAWHGTWQNDEVYNRRGQRSINTPFTVFDMEAEASTNTPIRKLGFFFGSNRETAEFYAQYAGAKKLGGEPRVISVFLNLGDSKKLPFSVASELMNYGNLPEQKYKTKKEAEKASDKLKNKLETIGYNSIIFSENNSPVELVVFNPSQIKSADPVTYDDAGNVIPLSQRFNLETPDIRFQPDPLSPNIQVGSNGTRIIKSPSGKFRVYSVTGTLLGIRDTEQAAKKLATK